MDRGNWVLIANARAARFLARRDGEEHWDPIVELEDELARARAGELVSDRAGYAAASHGRGGTAYESRSDPARKEHELFARRVARAAGEAVSAGRCRGLSLFASSAFLGALRAELDESVQRVVTGSYAVDLTSFEGADLDQRIARQLAGG